MRPYLAVIKDSFREALASRVLWVLLVLCTVFLLALTPVSLQTRLPTHFQFQHGIDMAGWAKKVLAEKEAEGPNVSKHVLQLINGAAKEAMPAVATGDAQSVEQVELFAGLNEIVDNPQLYDEDLWSHYELSDEARKYIESDRELASSEVARLNRLLLEAAFPESMPPATDEELVAGYLTWEWGAIPVSKTTVMDTALALFADSLLGVLGVFIAILVTAPMIPKTFDTGAIDVLLSKPVSRVLLFLTKFLGGCAFIGVIATYLIVGLWAIAGIRHDYWNHRFLLCVPLLLFLFAIYYSISALAAAIWKNTTVSIAFTVVFWGICVTVGGAKQTVEIFVMAYKRVDHIDLVDDAIVTTTGLHDADMSWNSKRIDENGEATAVFENDRYGATSGVYLGPTLSGDQSHLLVVANPGHMSHWLDNAHLFAAPLSGGKTIRGPVVPSNTTHLFVDSNGQSIVVSANGIYRLNLPLDQWKAKADPKKEKEKEKDDEDKNTREQLDAEVAKHYTKISPASWSWPTSATQDRSGGRIAVFASGQLRVYEIDEQGNYQLLKATDVKLAKPKLCLAGDTLAVGTKDGGLKIYQPGTLQLRSEFEPANEGVKRIVASPSGAHFAVLYDHRDMWMYAPADDAISKPNISSQGDVTAAAFGDSESLYIAHSFNILTRYDANSLAPSQEIAPEMGMPERVYRYLIKPLYTIFPKPGELGNMVRYLVTGKQTVDTGRRSVKVDIWGPVLSNLAFLTIVLAVASIYVQRKDF